MQLGKSSERSITRTQALLWGIILLLFPLCCLLSVGYRVVNGAPPDIAALLDFGATATLGISQEGEPGAQETPLPSETTQPGETATTQPSDSTPSVSPTLPPIPVAACIPSDTERLEGQVQQVIDGDEIRVRVGQDELIVRYIGIIAPELADDYGAEASNENVSLVLLKQVTLVRDVTDRDSEGKLPRYVLVGDIFVNHELARRGLALAENLPPDLACSDALQAAEADAQAANAGLWAPTPEPTNTLAPPPTATPEEVSVTCSCTGDDLDCSDFATVRAARECYLKCILRGHGDVYDLDSDDNAIACDE
jgi:micrococcal nuclease